jgi:hypothetical protein
MAIYQGDIGIHDIKLGSIDVFEIYQGSKLVYPENTEVTITFKLNVSGTVTINGYTPVISENNTKFVFTIPVKINYTAIIEADHYKSQTITGNSGYLPITHNVELEWEQRFISYTVTFPTDGVKVLFDGIEKGVITNGKLVVLIDDTEAKDSYTVTFKGSKASTYDTSTLTVVDSAIANTGGSYDLKLPTSSVKSGYKRTDYASSTGSITKGSTYAGTWIETVVNLTASFTSSTTLGSISNNVLTIPNNESTNAKSGTLTVVFTLENKQTKEVSAALNQAAGAKVYTNWVLDLQTDGTSVEAKGGTRTITANVARRTITANVARRTYKWNNTGTVYSETTTPTLSISGSASLSGNSIIFTSNESVSARSAVLTASYVGLSKTVTITQAAGSKVYSAWSAWTVSISASTQTIGASGGTSTITTSASRSRTWTWNGVGTTHTDTETGTPTLSGTATGFTLSGTTVTASNNESTNSRSINITATHSGVTKSITISQSAGSKVYGSWSKWTINKSSSGTTIAASGGSGTVSAPTAIRTRSYTWNGTGTSYTEQGTGTPTLTKQSGDGSFSVSGTTATVSYGNNTTISSKSTVVRATMDTEYVDTTFTQSAGSKIYGSWSIWSVYCNASSFTVSASGGSVTIYSGASRSRNWTWNGVSGSGGTENESGTPTLSASGSGSLSGTTLSYGNNTSTSSRTTRVTASYGGSSNYCDITQSAGSKTYSSWGAWTITLTANPTTIAAAGGNSTLSTSATRSRTWQWNGTGTTYTEQDSGTPTLSKVSGAATLNSKTVNYGNNTSTNSRSSVFRATIDSATKDITITQSAGSLVYQNVIYHTTYYGTGPDTGIDSTTYPNICEVDKDISSDGELIYVYYKIYTTQKYTWNGVEGSGGTTYRYYTASDIVTISKVNCDVLVGNDSTVGDNMIAFGIQVLSNSSTSSRTWYVEWRWLGSQNNTTRGTQQGSPVVGRFCIQNNKFTTTNVALPVYINSMNVDTIYDGETTYNNIISSPVSVYVYIPTNVSTFYSGKLQFWFEHEDGSGNKYNCSLSNYSTVSGISLSNNGTVIGVNSNTTVSGFTILCQFTMTSNNIVFNIRVLVEA